MDSKTKSAKQSTQPHWDFMSPSAMLLYAVLAVIALGLIMSTR